MTLEPEALSAITKAAGDGEISISMGRVEQAELSEEAQAMVGDRPVYDFSITADGENVTGFEGGKVTLALPYTLKEGESAGRVTAYYIDSSGEVVEMADAKYDEELGAIVFSTDHFSRFAVGYKKIKFSDVSGWAEEYIYYLADRGLVTGKTETTFAPGDHITRAEFAAIYARMSGADLTSYSSTPFKDVKAGDWYFGAVAWAAEKGIINGYEGRFNPYEEITRQDMAVIAVRYAKNVEGYALPEAVEAFSFTDESEISDYAGAAVGALQRAGVISGKGDGLFAPAEPATRAEAAKIIAVQMQLMRK